MSLRARAAQDVRELNTSDWGLPVEFTDPDGNRMTTDAVTGEPLKSIQVLYDRKTLNLETGEEIVIKEPIIVMSRKSMTRIPLADEIWHVRFPEDPENPTILSDYILSGAHAPEGGQALNFIRLYPQKAEAA